MTASVFVISCEHAGNRVPEMFANEFDGAEEVLQSHRGWDPGAIVIAQDLAQSLMVPCYFHDYTRLLIEPNRSIGHPQLFSEFTDQLMDEDKDYLIQTYYKPYRDKVKQVIRSLIAENKQVIHLSIHTFTPVWEGREREVEIGLLFDEDRSAEVSFCVQLKNMLDLSQTYVVKFNEPYRGSDDGFTTALRQCLGQDQYLGIEIEVNQKFKDSRKMTIISQQLRDGIEKSLR